MKASIKFQEDRKPLLRAKIPLNVLSFPFQSGIVAGESKELALNLSTFFDAGPALKIAYRPNDPQNPFSFICKTGIGNFGSPISSPFTMSAEFNLPGGRQNPSFFVHFKPKFGDFSFKKSHASVKKAEPPRAPGAGRIEEIPLVKHGYIGAGVGKIAVLPPETAAVATGVAQNLISQMEMKASTAFPITSHARVDLRWCLRFPPSAAADGEEDAVIVGRSESRAGISFAKLPTLLMDKISIEHVVKKGVKDPIVAGSGGLGLAGSSDVVGAWLEVKKQLEAIQSENGLLRKAFDDLRSELGAGKVDLAAGCRKLIAVEGDVNGGGSKNAAVKGGK